MRKITIPTAVITGELDFIVAEKVTVPVFEENLINCPSQIIEIPKVNHWFETCKTGSINDYGKTTEIISPAFLQVVSDFVQENIQRLDENHEVTN